MSHDWSAPQSRGRTVVCVASVCLREPVSHRAGRCHPSLCSFVHIVTVGTFVRILGALWKTRATCSAPQTKSPRFGTGALVGRGLAGVLRPLAAWAGGRADNGFDVVDEFVDVRRHRSQFGGQ